MGKRSKFPSEYAQVEDLPVKFLIDLELLSGREFNSPLVSLPPWTPPSVLRESVVWVHHFSLVYLR